MLPEGPSGSHEVRWLPRCVWSPAEQRRVPGEGPPPPLHPRRGQAVPVPRPPLRPQSCMDPILAFGDSSENQPELNSEPHSRLSLRSGTPPPLSRRGPSPAASCRTPPIETHPMRFASDEGSIHRGGMCQPRDYFDRRMPESGS